MEKEVEVYRRNDHNGHLRLVATFESLDALVDATHPLDNFSCCDTDRCRYNLHYWDSESNRTVFDHSLSIWLRDTSTFCYVVYNANGKVVPPDVLVGIRRRQNYERRHRWTYWRTCGSKRSNGHYFRRMKTTQERRWAHAWDDEEFAPKPRSKRCGHNLPNVWDDYWRCGDGKSWKNYRKHQWKEKRGGNRHP